MNITDAIIANASRMSIATAVMVQFNISVSTVSSLPVLSVSSLPLLSVVLAAFFLIESAFIMFLNGFAVITIVMNPKMQTRVNKVILSLLTADLLISFMLPFHASFLILPSLSINRYACVIRYAINYVLCLSSVLSLLLITCDRYVAIAHPFHYNNHGSLPRLNIFLAGIWIYSIGYGIAVILWHRWPVACNPETVMPPGKLLRPQVRYFIIYQYHIYLDIQIAWIQVVDRNMPYWMMTMKLYHATLKHWL